MTANILADIVEANSVVLGLDWIPYQDISRDLLAVLYSNSKFVLWNAQTCTPLWMKNYDTQISCFLLDPFDFRNLLFRAKDCFILINEVCWNQSPPFAGRRISLWNASRNVSSVKNVEDADFRLSSSLRATAKAVISEIFFGTSKVQKQLPTISTETKPQNKVENPIQLLFHGFKKQIILFVYPKEILLMDLVVFEIVGSIKLEPHMSPFVQIHSFRQADVLLCLHSNGAMSLHHGVSRRILTESVTEDNEAEADYIYLPVGETAAVSRSRNCRVLFMCVEPSLELSVTLLCSDGRLEFYIIEKNPTVTFPDSNDVERTWPLWSLSEVVKSFIDPECPVPASLRLKYKGFYMGSSPNPTICSVCPAHYLLSACENTPELLIAVGTLRGTVMIFDIPSGRLKREYQLLNVPICGLAWGSLQVARGSALCLFAYGFLSQEGESTGASNCVKNFITRLNLLTGHQRPVRTQHADDQEFHLLKRALDRSLSDERRSRWWNYASELAELSTGSISQIRLIRVSHLGQYLSILYENWPLEIWDARKLVLLSTVPAQQGRPIALTWSSISQPRSLEAREPMVSGGLANIRTGSEEIGTSPQMISCNASYQRESFILSICSTGLKLISVEGSDIDTSVISNNVIQSIPSPSNNLISTAAWHSPLLAFGSTDGCIAVRNLQAKETVVRYAGFFIPTEAVGRLPPSQNDLRHGLAFHGTNSGPNLPLSGPTKANPAAVRRLEFLSGPSTTTRLLVLCNSAVMVFQPRRMVLVCVVRFGSPQERTIIDADWATPISSLLTVPTCALLMIDGSIRLAMAGSLDANIEVSDKERPASELAFYHPSSEFYFNSSFVDEFAITDLPLIPSILPTNISLTLRHLLQHQPWRNSVSTTDPSTVSLHQNVDDVVPNYHLECPPLGMGFKQVQSAVNRFLTALKKDSNIQSAFESPNALVAERCLLTALLFGDNCEIRFWRLAIYRLLLKDSKSSNSMLERLFLPDQSWDALADQSKYRSAVLERVNAYLKIHSDSEQNKVCSQRLLMLGFHDQAVKRLASTQADSPTFTLDMFRASLLAANACIQELGQELETSTRAHLNFRSTSKLLAANLISSAHVDEGIELLCILGLRAEACRYLETYNYWEKAVWLAKCTLKESEANEVMQKWATYLLSKEMSNKTLAVFIYVFLGQHTAVLSLLCSLRQYQLAARYLEACLEVGVIKMDAHIENLRSQIFLEFARNLMSLGHQQSAAYYASFADADGAKLLEEIDFLLN